MKQTAGLAILFAAVVLLSYLYDNAGQAKLRLPASIALRGAWLERGLIAQIRNYSPQTLRATADKSVTGQGVSARER